MLEGIRIVELAEGVAGPMAALRLADLGAEVIKVEPAEGDWMRAAAPAMPDGTAAAFFALNRGKRSVALGADEAAAAPLLAALVARADVLVTDRDAATLRALGLDEALAREDLVIASVSDWGEEGPWAGRPGSELTAQAVAGYTRYLGAAELPPRRLGADVAGGGAGIFTAQAVLAALLVRRRGGGGQHVSTSLLNALLSLKSIQLAAQSDPDQYSGPRVGGPQDPPERGWNTGDGRLFFSFGGSVGATGRPGWSQFVEEIGMAELLEDKRLDPNGKNSTGHGSLVHALRPTYEKGFARFTAAELEAKIRRYGANAARYMTAAETFAHPQTEALGILREVPSEGGSAKVRAFPARFSRSATGCAGLAPRLGQHNEEIAAACGLSAATLREAGALS